MYDVGNQPLPAGFARNLIVVTTLVMSIMAAVDLTIVTVALPYMAGSLGATSANIGWVVTMYSVSSAVSVGITGHMSRLMGRKRLCLLAVTGFVASSVMCGLAQNLGEIVLFRFIQGAFSGPLIPVAQSILVDAFPEKERVKGITLWVMGVMVGPALGPAVGGWFAQNMDWRWNFWVNIPIGIVAVLLILKNVREVPPQRLRTDWLGLALLLLFMISFQTVLDRGNIEDWFGSREIVLLAILAAASGTAFVWRGWALGPANIMNLRLLRDMNFTVCSVLITVIAMVFLALLVLTPEVFVDYFGWEVSTAGLVIGSYGIAGLFGSYLGGKLTPRLGVHVVILLSSAFMALGWWEFSRFSFGVSIWQAMKPGMYMEFGLLLIFGSLASQAFKNLRPEQRDEGAALFNFVKTTGFSLGVSAVSTFLYRGTQANWTRYVGDLDFAKPGFGPWLQGLKGPFQDRVEIAVLSQALSRQTDMLTFVQAAEALCLLALLCSVTALLLPHGGPHSSMASPEALPADAA